MNPAQKLLAVALTATVALSAQARAEDKLGGLLGTTFDLEETLGFELPTSAQKWVEKELDRLVRQHDEALRGGIEAPCACFDAPAAPAAPAAPVTTYTYGTVTYGAPYGQSPYGLLPSPYQYQYQYGYHHVVVPQGRW